MCLWFIVRTSCGCRENVEKPEGSPSWELPAARDTNLKELLWGTGTPPPLDILESQPPSLNWSSLSMEISPTSEPALGHSVSKVEKTVFSWGISYFLVRWSDQTFFESSYKTKTENICRCWIFVKTKDLSKIFVKNVPSEVCIGYKTQFLKKIWWCWPQAADSFSL